MLKRLIILASGLLLALSVSAPAMAQNGKTFYWISHGSPTDPVWTYFLAGADQWAKDTGNTVNTSFHSGDVPSQQDAVRAAIAAGADGIVTSSPDPGSLVEVVSRGAMRQASRSSISTRPTRGELRCLCRYRTTSTSGERWAQYLVDGGYVKSGDTVFTPVEVPGATYGEQEKQGIMSVFDPLGIKIDAIETGLDQAQIISTMSDYLTANKDKIGGHDRPWRPRHRQRRACLGPGRHQSRRHPGGRLGQLARHGPGDPGRLRPCRACGRTPSCRATWLCRLASQAANGIPVPHSSSTADAPGFDIASSGRSTTRTTAQSYLDLLTAK